MNIHHIKFSALRFLHQSVHTIALFALPPRSSIIISLSHGARASNIIWVAVPRIYRRRAIHLNLNGFQFYRNSETTKFSSCYRIYLRAIYRHVICTYLLRLLFVRPTTITNLSNCQRKLFRLLLRNAFEIVAIHDIILDPSNSRFFRKEWFLYRYLVEMLIWKYCDLLLIVQNYMFRKLNDLEFRDILQRIIKIAFIVNLQF